MPAAWVSAAVGVYGALSSDGGSGGGGGGSDNDQAQADIAKDQYNEYKTTYRPLERQMVADAQNFDTPEAYNRAAGEAQATVSSEIGKAQDRLMRQPGLDPSSAASTVANTNMQLKGAAMGATAQNKARMGIQDMAWARKKDAVSLGKGLVSDASNGFARASNGGLANARFQQETANSNASGLGAIAGGLSKLDWSKFGGSSGGNAPAQSSYGASNTDYMSGNAGTSNIIYTGE